MITTKPAIAPDVTRDAHQLRVVLLHKPWKQLETEQRNKVREEMAAFFEGLAEQIRSELE